MSAIQTYRNVCRSTVFSLHRVYRQWAAFYQLVLSSHNGKFLEYQNIPLSFFQVAISNYQQHNPKTPRTPANTVTAKDEVENDVSFEYSQVAPDQTPVAKNEI